eukprot:CAMPEP_0119003778 /NCGR_PEP_ID=MMETSP1176-20130426/758_1 /TAXON_ID=265551 /ORGANISM="Synedropsis recta cf, Strain CCMP1620" /LENGTH=284 /DNA_ID=CAMNT_0006955405 /DNA_START=66 /DNA_END=920 /DNA_ORIENTATION=+
MSKTLDLKALSNTLGDGPMRYAPAGERSIEEQIAALTPEEKECFDTLKAKWNDKDRKKKPHDYSDEMILRFARCSPGSKKFNEKAAWKVMKKCDPKYLDLTATELEEQLLSKTLFIVPGLKSSEGHDVFYMRPSRYFPMETSIKTIIDNLAYCMQTMVEKEHACTEGVAFLANLDGWTMGNFSVSYCLEFMKMLQGKSPVRVRLFLIVDPPTWFDLIWKVMKTVLASDFRKKVHMIPREELEDFLMEGAPDYLCDDILGGKVETDEMIKDFVTYRKEVEKAESS